MKVLIDNGHGCDTKGKRSPDGRLYEYQWARIVAKRIEDRLKALGIDAERIVTEDKDVSLTERVQRVNRVCKQLGAKNVCLISIHVNASGCNGWRSARGFSAWVYTHASKESQRLAQLLFAEADKRRLRGNRSVPACRYWTANFYILRYSACPAVLTENLFQDNRLDVNYLLTEEGKNTIVDAHVEAIKQYISEL